MNSIPFKIVRFSSRFRHYGIRTKFTIIMSVGSLVALIMVASTITFYEYYSYQEKTLEDLNTQGDIIKEHLGVAMSFSDSLSASESLTAFRTNTNIPAAMVIDLQGDVFAAYTREDIDSPSHFDVLPATGLIRNQFIIVKEVHSSDAHLGYLYFRHEIPSLASRLIQYFPFILVFFLALVLLNIIVASVSSIFIIEPMQQLTQTANDITATHDYSLRTNLNSLDEIGKLANTLNELVSTA